MSGTSKPMALAAKVVRTALNPARDLKNNNRNKWWRTYLLYCEGHAYPVLLHQHLPPSFLFIHNVSNQPSKGSLRRPTGCVYSLRRVRACEGTLSPSYKTLPEFRLTSFIRTRGRSLRRWTWEEKWTRFWVVPSQHTDDASSWSKWRWTQPEVSIWTIKIRAEVCDCNLNWSRFLHIHIIVVVWRHFFFT